MNFKKNEQGACPICGKENLEYGSIEPDDTGIYYPWECKNKKCKATGKEYYSIEFDSHGQVQDNNGLYILNDEGY